MGIRPCRFDYCAGRHGARGVTEAYAPCKRVAAVRIRAGPFGAAVEFFGRASPRAAASTPGPHLSHPAALFLWQLGLGAGSDPYKIEAPVQLGELPSRPAVVEKVIG